MATASPLFRHHVPPGRSPGPAKGLHPLDSRPSSLRWLPRFAPFPPGRQGECVLTLARRYAARLRDPLAHPHPHHPGPIGPWPRVSMRPRDVLAAPRAAENDHAHLPWEHARKLVRAHPAETATWGSGSVGCASANHLPQHTKRALPDNALTGPSAKRTWQKARQAAPNWGLGLTA